MSASPELFQGLGPYSIPQLREIAKDAGIPDVVVHGARSGLRSCLDDLVRGRSVILLWLETPDFGHYILLHLRRPGGKVKLELFDPLGTDNESQSWEAYMDDPSGLNSPPGGGRGLRSILQGLHEGGLDLSYNQPSNGPQPDDANSCGLWCLLRAGLPQMSPTEFAREFRRR